MGVVTTLAGLAGSAGSADGTNIAARFNTPYLLAADNNGNVYVGDSYNHTIRKAAPVGTNWVVTTLAGLAGSFGSCRWDWKRRVVLFPVRRGRGRRRNLYVGGGNSPVIRKGLPAGSVPAPILEPPSLAAGQFSFAITGLPNLAVDLESSGDLSQWQLVGTYILEGGTNSFAGQATRGRPVLPRPRALNQRVLPPLSSFNSQTMRVPMPMLATQGPAQLPLHAQPSRGHKPLSGFGQLIMSLTFSPRAEPPRAFTREKRGHRPSRVECCLAPGDFATG